MNEVGSGGGLRKGIPYQDVIAEMETASAQDADWRAARTWSLVYHADREVEAIVQAAYTRFMATNGLSPVAFPSLGRFESEVIAGVGTLLGAPEGAAGSMTSGGTESLLLALKAARDWAAVHRRDRGEFEFLLPETAHPALYKAGHYLGVKPVPVPVGPDFRADAAAARKLATPRTILVVGSAPAFPHGVVDPIGELAALAAERGILCHVDASVGGMMLPFLERLGRRIPPWDFRVPGVTSISTDLHKYGYAAKGASAILYRSRELRRFQFFVQPGWPGGMYASPTLAGTRPGGAIAAAWAVLRLLGEDGYLRLARTASEAARRLMEGICAIPGLFILGEPDMTLFAFAARDFDTYALGDCMRRRGWRLDRQQLPPSLHLVVTANHAKVVDAFLADLRESAAEARGQAPGVAGAAYGMLGEAPPGANAEDFLLDFLDQVL